MTGKIKASTCFFCATAVAVVIALYNFTLSPLLPVPERGVWRINPRFNLNDGIKDRFSAIDVHLTINGKEVELNLEENELLKTYPPVFLTKNDGSITKINIDNKSIQKPTFLQDKKGRAAVMLQKNATQQYGSAYEIEGIIFYESETYQISPIRVATSDASKKVEFSHELKRLSSLHTSDKVLRTANKRLGQGNERDLTRHVHRARRTASPTYQVQLLFVLDNSTFRKFYDNLPYNDTQEKESAAVQNIVTYFAQVSNLVDVQFAGISKPQLAISVKLTSVYIAKTSIQSNWTENTNAQFMNVIEKTGRQFVKGGETLNSFTTWIYGEPGAIIRSSAPKFDHAVLFTAYEMIKTDEYMENKQLVGLANVGSMCSSDSASVVRHIEAIRDAETCAHEIGHSFGAQHDGFNNSCNSSMQYVMAQSSAPRTNETLENMFLFSSCSEDYFESFILSLENNCLTDFEPHAKSSWGLLPGPMFSPTELCREIFGSSFKACGSREYGRKICNELRCYNASAPISSVFNCSLLGSRVPDGTSCGNKRWCQAGGCVYNSSAPEALVIKVMASD